MNKEQKKTIDKVIAIFMYGIFLPFVLLALIAKGMNICMEYLFENALNPFYNKVCRIVRGPIPNSAVYILDEEHKIWANLIFVNMIKWYIIIVGAISVVRIVNLKRIMV